MLIRSQNKLSIVNMDAIDTIHIREVEYSKEAEYEVIAFNGETESYLGTYSTEEKAIKVLDMIEAKYISGTEVIVDDCIACKVMPRNIVFYMPSNDEVKVG